MLVGLFVISLPGGNMYFSGYKRSFTVAFTLKNVILECLLLCSRYSNQHGRQQLSRHKSEEFGRIVFQTAAEGVKDTHGDEVNEKKCLSTLKQQIDRVPSSMVSVETNLSKPSNLGCRQ